MVLAREVGSEQANDRQVHSAGGEQSQHGRKPPRHLGRPRPIVGLVLGQPQRVRAIREERSVAGAFVQSAAIQLGQVRDQGGRGLPGRIRPAARLRPPARQRRGAKESASSCQRSSSQLPSGDIPEASPRSCSRIAIATVDSVIRQDDKEGPDSVAIEILLLDPMRPDTLGLNNRSGEGRAPAGRRVAFRLVPERLRAAVPG